MRLDVNLEQGMEIKRKVEAQMLYLQIDDMFTVKQLFTMIKETEKRQNEISKNCRKDERRCFLHDFEIYFLLK